MKLLPLLIRGSGPMYVCKSKLDGLSKRLLNIKNKPPAQASQIALLASTISLLLILIIAPALHGQPQNQQPRPGVCGSRGSNSETVSGSRFALGFQASTLGLGPELGMRLGCRFNLRIGFNTFNYRRDLSDSGIEYASAFRLRSVQGLVDWFPFSRSIHFSGGLLIYNQNHITANAVFPNNQILDVGNQKVLSNPANPITGNETSRVRTVAPLFAVGFGNFVPRTRSMGFSIDVGVVLQGAPQSTFVLDGSACDPSGVFCTAIKTDPSAQAEALSDTRSINKALFFLKYYPFVSVEMGYRF